MISDTIKNADLYLKINKGFETAFNFLRSDKCTSLQPGSYPLENGCRANVSQYETLDENLFEAHRCYIDIQYISSGEECVEYVPLEHCTTEKEYNEECDAWLGTANDMVQQLKLFSGNFMIFFPGDAHKPCLTLNEKKTVNKVVLKVPVV